MSESNIKAEGTTIAEYLKRKSNEVFVIPEYQRRYSWTVEHCDRLLQSINSYIGFAQNNDDAEPCFLGTVIAGLTPAPL